MGSGYNSVGASPDSDSMVESESESGVGLMLCGLGLGLMPHGLGLTPCGLGLKHESGQHLKGKCRHFKSNNEQLGKEIIFCNIKEESENF